MGAALARALPVAASLVGRPLHHFALIAGLPTIVACAPAAALTAELREAFERCVRHEWQVGQPCISRAWACTIMWPALTWICVGGVQ